MPDRGGKEIAKSYISKMNIHVHHNLYQWSASSHNCPTKHILTWSYFPTILFCKCYLYLSITFWPCFLHISACCSLFTSLLFNPYLELFLFIAFLSFFSPSCLCQCCFPFLFLISASMWEDYFYFMSYLHCH